MPKVFSKNCRINVIEYGTACNDYSFLSTLKRYLNRILHPSKA